MEPKEKEHINVYLRVPLALIVVFAVISILQLIFLPQLGIGSVIFAGIYGIVIAIYYSFVRKRFRSEVLSYATNYATVQKQLLREFQIPYAVLDETGRFLWMNDAFSVLTGKDSHYQKSASTLFPEITREEIERQEKDSFSIRVDFEGRIYEAKMQRLTFSQPDHLKHGMLGMIGGKLVAMMLFDETQLTRLKKTVKDQKLVTALIYIDNYEETVETVEDVKRSLLTAIIDRKISRYFRDTDAVIRKMEKDKYFIIFQQKYLQQMKENKFSLLEDIKTTKAGNENEITISMGIGADADGYNQNAEYSRAAMDLALGRGGSQVVIKSGEKVEYYGLRGKEVARNTRVKARVKAQALREMMESKESVIVMGHQISDVDALGAGIGVYSAARELGKKCQIVLNTITTSLRPLVDGFSTENGYPEDLFINSEEALELVNEKTLVMVVDTNRPNYTECPDLLKKSKSIVVFDHHRQGSERIENPVLSYIEPYASSTCEMIAEMLQYFSERMQLTPEEADCIYAGILIDTNNYMTKTGVRTFEAAAYLKRSGADVTRVRKLLREDMMTYKARAEVVRHAEVYKGAFAISECVANDLESPTIVGAQASNELLNIVGIKASFVLTDFKGKIYVSSRSIDEIDVQLIMERLGGGGHLNVAGAQIQDETIEEVKQRVKDIIDIMIEEGEIKL